MAKGRDPSFPFYPDDWIRDSKVQSLPRELRGCLLGIWSIAWMEGPIPEDRISGVARLIDATIEETRTLLGKFFIQTEAGWVSPRLEAEREQRVEKRAKQTERARRGAEERWGRNAPSNAQASPKHCLADATHRGPSMHQALPSDALHTHTHTRSHSQGEGEDLHESGSSSEVRTGSTVRRTTSEPDGPDEPVSPEEREERRRLAADVQELLRDGWGAA